MKSYLYKSLCWALVSCSVSLGWAYQVNSMPTTDSNIKTAPWLEEESQPEFEFTRQAPQTPWNQVVREQLSYPLPQKVTLSSPVGMRTHPITGRYQFHYGVDLPAPQGTPILAAFSGEVVFADRFGGLGKVVILYHAGEQVTRYAHMSKMIVSPGQTVRQGEMIGHVGSTGLSQGSHLHFEWWQRQGPGDSDWVVFDPSVLWK